MPSGAGGATPLVTRWWWVRHAPITAPDGTIAGRLDLPADLSDTGAVTGLARRLPSSAMWIASPLVRAAATATALMRVQGVDPVPLLDDALVEQDFGRWQGRTHAELGDGADVRAFWADPANAAPPEGESFADLCARVAPAIRRLTTTHAGRDIVAVAHAGPIRAAIGLALGLMPERMLSLSIDCLHLCRLDHVSTGEGGLWRIVAVNVPPD